MLHESSQSIENVYHKVMAYQKSANSAMIKQVYIISMTIMINNRYQTCLHPCNVYISNNEKE